MCFQGDLFTVINGGWEFSDPFISSAKVDLTGLGSNQQRIHTNLTIKALYFFYVLVFKAFC